MKLYNINDHYIFIFCLHLLLVEYESKYTDFWINKMEFNFNVICLLYSCQNFNV